MAGAWEARQPDLLIGIPHVGLVTTNWALELRALNIGPGTHIRGWSGVPVDVARNRLVRDAREVGTRFIFFLDSDVIPADYNAITILMAQELPIVSGLYWSKKGSPAMWKWIEEKKSYAPIIQFPTNNLVEVDALPAGCLLVDMRVFGVLERAGLPWFEWEIDDPANQAGKYSEDFTFAQHCQKAGFKLYVHTGVQFHHEQMVSWTPTGRVLGQQTP